jgi:hypothetical protein
MSMAVLVALGVAAAPFAVVLGLLMWADRRDRRRLDVHVRQVVLTDCVHERLGAVAAPVVRRDRRGWQVRLAVPVERPGLTEALVAIVRETCAPGDGGRQSLEIVLSRQTAAAPVKAASSRSTRWEPVSWT